MSSFLHSLVSASKHMYQFPPKRKVVVLGETIEYVTAGDNGPSVVLISGAGGPIEGWHKVFGPASSFSRVFAYNRPGLGRSYKPEVPQVGSHLVASLRAALEAAKIPAPYVLVAHSLGGLIANLFARLWPSEVLAVVLVEATAPEDPSVLAAHETTFQRIVKGLLNKLAPMHPNAEVQHVERTVSEIMSAPSFPPIPLTIISGRSYAMAWATSAQALVLRAEHQRKLAELSPLATHIIANRSGHFPQFTEPEVVIAAVKEAANASFERTSQGLRPCAVSHVKRYEE